MAPHHIIINISEAQRKKFANKIVITKISMVKVFWDTPYIEILLCQLARILQYYRHN